MAFRLVAFATLIAYTCAGNIPIAAPVAYAAAPTHLALAAPVAKAVVAQTEDYDPNPQYSYGYDIQDGLTGDSKSQSETRNGDVVEGSYSVVDPDGTKRTVEYTADPINGFNAVVHREPVSVPAIAKVATPVAYAAAPAAYASPAVYAAPAAYASPAAYAAPAAYAVSPARFSAPVAYAAPHHAPIAYAAAPAVAKISYASPGFSYHI